MDERKKLNKGEFGPCTFDLSSYVTEKVPKTDFFLGVLGYKVY